MERKDDEEEGKEKKGEVKEEEEEVVEEEEGRRAAAEREKQESECALGWDGAPPRSKQLYLIMHNPVRFQNKIQFPGIPLVRFTETRLSAICKRL